MNYSVKEVANLTGVTIRTLRYYDEIDLLPIERNSSNHRIYNTLDILKLTMICSLKTIGVPLEDIRGILENSSESIDDTLRLQGQIIYMKMNQLQKQKEKVELMISQREQDKSIEEVLLDEYIDFEAVDIEELYAYISHRQIDFDYFFEKIYKQKQDKIQAEGIMRKFIEYLNEEYHGYFTTDRLKELAETYRTEQARLYFKKYDEGFHLYLSDLVLKCLDESG